MDQEILKNKLSDFGLRAITLNFSMTCNLRCSYCYLPKEPTIMSSLNKETIEWLSSGRAEEDILRLMDPDRLCCLGLWGGEPTFNFPYLEKRLKFYYEKFPVLDRIHFSTNLSQEQQVDNIINLAKEIDRLNELYNRKLLLSVQVSIDGPSELGNNRIGSQPEVIMKNLGNLAIRARGIKCINHINLKGTHDSESILILQEEENLIKHYSFFDDFYYEINKLTDVPVHNGEYISYVYPGDYSVKEGKAAAKMLNILLSEEFKNLPWKTNNLSFYDQGFFRFVRLARVNAANKERQMRNRKITCSAGLSELAIDCLGRVHLCHNTFFFNDQIEKIIERFSSQSSSGIDFSKELIFLKNRYITPNEDYLRLLRILHNMNHSMNTPSMVAQCYELLIREMARIGQIDKKYAYDDSARNLAITYLTMSERLCPSSSISSMGSPFLQDTSHIKLFLNGYLDECIKGIRRMNTNE